MTSESIILVEGFDDRAFFKGLVAALESTDCTEDTSGKKVTGGRYGYRTRGGHFFQIVPVHGESNLVPAASRVLYDLDTRPLRRMLVVRDSDLSAAAPAAVRAVPKALFDVAQKLDEAASFAAGRIELPTLGATVDCLSLRVEDDPSADLPDKQTLERVVCAAIRAAYPDRAASVRDWLASRGEGAPATGHKEHAWSHMAGWYAAYGCAEFYSRLWRDDLIRPELQTRLEACGVWQAVVELCDEDD